MHAQTAHARIFPGVSVFARNNSDFAIAPEAAIAASNVVPFQRLRREGARSTVEVKPCERPTLTARGADGWWRGAAILAVSLAAHGIALAAFNQPPESKASIGQEVITVELVLGADSNAGLADAPSPSEETQNSAAAEANSAPAVPEETQLPPEPEPQPVPQPQIIEEEALELAPKQAEPPPKPEPPRPQQAEAKPKKQAPPAPKPEPRKEKKSTRSPVNSVASMASSGVGRGSSADNATYRGMVAAHLSRYKQFPSDAKRLGTQGIPAVSFRLDANGRVTSVSLARSSGVESLDREVVAMVNRASPFPSPPDGRPQGFTVPVTFAIR